MDEPTLASTVKVGERLKLLRESLGYTQTAMARRCGITLQTWNNYERGVSRISLSEAFKLKTQTGVPLDWIYLGEESGLPKHVVDQMNLYVRLRRKQYRLVGRG